jgi:hypothetical protein
MLHAKANIKITIDSAFNAICLWQLLFLALKLFRLMLIDDDDACAAIKSS